MKKITFPTFDKRRAAILAGFLAILFVVSLYAPTLQPLDAGYTVTRSLRFNDDDSANLSRTFPSAGNRKTWTYSLWFKKGSVYSGSNYAPVLTTGTNSIGVGGPSAAPNSFYFNQSGVYSAYTAATFRDSSAWYHVVYVYDTTQATATDRIKIYVNGERMTLTTEGGSLPSQNSDGPWNAAAAHNIGFYSPYYLDGYLADVHFVDGLALDPSYFGETNATTGSWVAKRYTGSYGTNGFKLNFADNSGVTATTLGKDTSGNGNNWTPNNFSVTAGEGNDSVTDVPTMSSTASNWATMNPLLTNTTLANGNLYVPSVGYYSAAGSTIAVTSGKWYVETLNGTRFGSYAAYGWYAVDAPETRTGALLGQLLYEAASNSGSLSKRAIGADLNSGYIGYYGNTLAGVGTFKEPDGTTIYSSGDLYLVTAIDLDVKQVWFGSAFTSDSAVTWFPGDPNTTPGYSIASVTTMAPGGVSFGVAPNSTSGTPYFHVNFGQRPFKFTPPIGFKSLNAYNMSEPTILKPNQYFEAKTYTGNGSTQSVTGLNFQPDFTWIKDRTSANAHRLFDALRRDYNYLSSNSNGAEVAGASTTLTAFTSDGFVLGTNSLFNTNSNNYISWNWDEGSVPGFDVVNFTGDGTTGRSISHDLGASPALVMVKRRSSAGSWTLWHKTFVTAGDTDYILLESTGAKNSAGATNNWNSTPPTSSTVTVAPTTNGSEVPYVMYLWSEVPGFSKFGSYTGNGSADGPFVYTGFKPAYILVKRTDTTANWENLDSARDPFNPANHHLYPNVADAESVTDNYDLLSNGFKLRSTGAGRNASGGTYIYAAFAEYPFKYTNGDDTSTITKSLRFNDDDSAYLNRTPAGAGTSDKIATISFWAKRAGLTSTYMFVYGTASAIDYIGFDNNTYAERLWVRIGNADMYFNGAQREYGAWSHYVVSVDTTQATAANRVRVYQDGVEMTLTAGARPAQNATTYINQAQVQNIGRSASAGTYYYDGYLADFYSIDGQALAPTSFGQADTTTGRWEPKIYSGTYGANGFHLDFNDNSSVSKFALGEDSAGYTGVRYSITGAGTAQLSTAQSKFGGASAAMGGSTGRIPVTDTNLALGTGDFTIEGWFYFNSVSGNPMLFDFRPSSTQGAYPGIYLNSGALNYYANNSNAIVGTTILSTGQWYHVAVSRTGTNTRLFLNGVQEGSTYSDSTNYLLGANAAIGNGGHTSTLYLDGYIDDFRIYSGVSKYAGTFTPPGAALPIGPSDPNWKYVVAALPMDGANAATSFSVYTGGNHWTANNFSVTAGVGNDSLNDSPSLGSGASNYATFNSVTNMRGAPTINNGGLGFNVASTAWMKSSFGVSSGKWYWEFEGDGTAASVSNLIPGVVQDDYPFPATDALAESSNKGWGMWTNNGNKLNGNWTGTAYGSAFGAGDYGMVALDLDNQKIWFGKNGTWFGSGDPAAGTNAAYTTLPTGKTYFPAVSSGSSYSGTSYINFGQRAYRGTPPSGFNSLNTYNLPTPTITKPNQYFEAKTYTGNGAARTISGLNFQPEFVWLKDRTSANAHGLFDPYRREYISLATNVNSAETATGSTTLGAFLSSGFVVGSAAAVNTNTNNYISWNWKEGAIPGFDMVTFSGDGSGAKNFNHSLGSAPEFAVLKSRNNVGTTGWNVWHAGLAGSNYYLDLSTTAAQNNSVSNFSGTWSASQFGVSATNGFNASGAENIAYLWSEVPGFSKFGSYTGNGAADGPFVYTGFKPRWILFKNASGTASSWSIFDTARSTYNVTNSNVFSNLTNAETSDTAYNIDILSNGFKIRNTNTGFNESGQTMIYAAFAERPFKYSNAGFGGGGGGGIIPFLLTDPF